MIFWNLCSTKKSNKRNFYFKIIRISASGESNPPASVITNVSQVQTQNTSNAINTTVHTNPIASLVSIHLFYGPLFN